MNRNGGSYQKVPRHDCSGRRDRGHLVLNLILMDCDGLERLGKRQQCLILCI